ncbi:MAG TPA: hypothetical protein VFQ85_14640 [Mycobacteriales bacterium]|nr:hypothetical protein [Mycobacteriales bacterium]
MTPHRRDLLKAALALPLLAACNGDKKPRATPSTPAGPVALQDVGGNAAPGLEIGDAEAELLRGTSRYAFGLVGPDGPVGGAKATVYVGQDPERPATATVQAVELVDSGLGGRGLYVASVPFPATGEYLVAIVAETAKGAMKGGTKVTVGATSKSPVPGQRPPAIRTPTTADPMGATPLCSRRPACGLHTVSLDAALRSGKPTVVVFAAPAFCQTELCGPDVDIVRDVAQRFAGRANFLHVEAYRGATNPTNGKLAPALDAFKFDSEPWLYVMDARGIVSDRISGAFAAVELTERLAKVGVS